MAGSAMAPADWYPDPASPDQLRYWDGAAWTLHTHPIVRADATATAAAIPAAIPAVAVVAVPAPVVEVAAGTDFLEPVYVREAQPAAVAQPAPVAQPARVPLARVGAGRVQFDGERDLAGNRAGQTARAQAMAIRRAHPFRSFAAWVVRAHDDERAWRVGADGEERVGRFLRRLGDEWRVLHAIPAGDGADIGHLVIGPAGVFTINTEHHRDGRVWVAERVLMVNGTRTDLAPKAVADAQRAARVLSLACERDVAVVPIVAVIARGFTVKAMPKDLWVLEAHRLARWLREQPVRLSAGEVEAIYVRARWERTWQPNG